MKYHEIISEMIGAKTITGYDAFKQNLDKLPQKNYLFQQDKTFDEFVKGLSNLGFRKLGKGTNAIVFDNPSYSYAIKIFRKDSAYAWYVNYCNDHKDNPHLPRFKGKLSTINKNTKWIRVEKLAHITFNCHLARNSPQRSDVERLFNLIDDYAVFLNYNNNIQPDEFLATKHENNAFFDNNKDVFDTLYDIKMNMPSSAEFDFVTTNVMLRGNIMVLSDPIGGSEDRINN